MSDATKTLEGRLTAVTGKANISNVNVWFAYRTTEGEETTVKSCSDQDGCFSFSLPDSRLDQARVGAELEGVSPVDLEPRGETLEPGDLILMVDDIVPSHLRYAG
jgi:hypothetical protein